MWRYFLESKSTSEAQCKLCPRILKTTGGSTKGLMDHLRLKHDKIYTQIQAGKVPDPAAKRPRIENHYKPKPKMDLQERVSRFCAEDLMSLSLVCKSKQIREFFNKLGFNGPTSRETVKKLLDQEHAKVKEVVIEKLDQLPVNFKMGF